MKFKAKYFIILLLAMLMSCNTSQKAEKAFPEVTEATLDSVIVHYLKELEKGTNMIEITKEEYRVLDSLERQLIKQLEYCLEKQELLNFEENQNKWQEEWIAKKDSIDNANQNVSFEDGQASKDMFLTWQYTYFKELRIIELLEIRDTNCK